MEEYIVKQKQTKQAAMMFLGLIMIAASIFCIMHGIRRNNVRYLASGVVGTLFFGLCLFFIIARFVRPKILLIINRDGVWDQSSAINAGFLSWDEILNFDVTNMSRQEFISIDIKNVDAYLAKLPVLKRKAVQANMALGFPPVSITLQTADRSISEVLEAMNLYRKAYLEMNR